MNKSNEDRNKVYEHITDEVESFIYQKGYVDDYEIETNSSVDLDCEHNIVTNRLTINIYSSRFGNRDL